MCSLRRRCFCPSPCSLIAGCACSYAGARHSVVRGCTPVCSLRRRCFCPSPCSLVAGCAGCYAGVHHGVVRGCTFAVSGGGASARRPARSSRAAPAPTLACTTVWCEAAPLCSLRRRCFCLSPCSLVAGCAGSYAGVHQGLWCEVAPVQSHAAALWPSPCSLVAGCAGSYAGAHLGEVRGCTCAVSGGGALAFALLARRGLRWLLRWRAPL